MKLSEILTNRSMLIFDDALNLGVTVGDYVFCIWHKSPTGFQLLHEEGPGYSLASITLRSVRHLAEKFLEDFVNGQYYRED